MDFTIGKLITFFYAILAVVVCGLCYWFYQINVQAYEVPELELSRATRISKVRPESGSQAVSRRLRAELEQQRDRIRDLQRLLEKREAVLKQQEAQIATQTATQLKLKQEADRYLEMVYAAVQESMDGNLRLLRSESLDALDANGSSEAALPVDADEMSESVPLTAVEVVEWELREAQQTAAESNEATLVEIQRATALRQAIIDAGELGVPLLTSLLTSESPDVRVWAVNTLGNTGTNSNVAMEGLISASKDPNIEVANAAKAAVEAMSASW